ncbi:MAG: hypothetical protein J0M34_02790 [Alphaproteobacteria bacterium]|nr:hypothetical protein [Alphaproteobacteria bacterium]
MYISVNKSTTTRRPVQYAALASGTISHVWSEEEEYSTLNRRKVRVELKRESDIQKKSAK